MNPAERSGSRTVDARAAAQQIAFSPMVFQSTRVLWKAGVLATIDKAGKPGETDAAIAQATGMSSYGLAVLLELAESAGVVERTDDRLRLTRTGRMVLYDRMTQVNVDFVHDVCYSGLFHLGDAIEQGRPAGLASLADGPTIYASLADLPEQVQRSWYAFDHFYSDRAFRAASKLVFEQPTRHVVDIGGNTGNWAEICLAESADTQVTIVDLPSQLQLARERFSNNERVGFHAADLLSGDATLPAGDVVWMSQFLDCFSEQEIVALLRRVAASVPANARVFVMETFVDCQRFDAAAFSLNAISLYFTAIANGTSRMYRWTTMRRLMQQAGLTIKATHHDLGLGHTLVECGLR